MTGGTYSVFRFAYGAYLAVSLALEAVGASGDPLTLGAEILGAIASVLVAIGYRDRIAAVIVAPAVLLTGLDAPSLVIPITMVAPLLVRLGLEGTPYGSLDARGRPDPAGEFTFPPALTFAIYAVLAGGYAAIAMPMVTAPEPSLSDWTFGACAALFLVLGIAAPTRFAGWVIMLAALVSQLVVGDHPMILPLFFVHLFAFDATAVAPRRHGSAERVFYDGSCGLCHRAVRFALAEDPDGEGFRFAPLGGDAFDEELPDDAKEGLPDSIVLLTAEGDVLVRSAAILRMMQGLGGLWRILAGFFGIVPRPLLDLGYDFVARIRHRLFAKPKDVCPIIPKHLRPRFDL
jgi:predicted DCC family thiol-disulfide oxidoreductase YuxK